MKNFEYVKFSRATARSNPSMIKREYSLLIDEFQNKVNSFKKEIKFQIPIDILLMAENDQTLQQTLTKEMYRDNSGNYIIPLIINLEQLHKINEIFKNKDSIHNYNIETLHKIKEELRKFENKFK